MKVKAIWPLVAMLSVPILAEAGPDNPVKRLESAKDNLEFIKQRRGHYSDASAAARLDYQNIKSECDVSLNALLAARARLKQVLRDAREKERGVPAEVDRPAPAADPREAMVEEREPAVNFRVLRVQYQMLKHLIANSPAPRPDMARRMMEIESELNRAKIELNHPDVEAVVRIEDVRRAEGVHRYNVSRRYAISRSIAIASGKHKKAIKLEHNAELAQAYWKQKVAETKAKARSRRRRGGSGGGDFGRVVGQSIVVPVKVFGGIAGGIFGGLFK